MSFDDESSRERSLYHLLSAKPLRPFRRSPSSTRLSSQGVGVIMCLHPFEAQCVPRIPVHRRSQPSRPPQASLSARIWHPHQDLLRHPAAFSRQIASEKSMHMSPPFRPHPAIQEASTGLLTCTPLLPRSFRRPEVFYLIFGISAGSERDTLGNPARTRRCPHFYFPTGELPGIGRDRQDPPPESGGDDGLVISDTQDCTMYTSSECHGFHSHGLGVGVARIDHAPLWQQSRV